MKKLFIIVTSCLTIQMIVCMKSPLITILPELNNALSNAYTQLAKVPFKPKPPYQPPIQPNKPTPPYQPPQPTQPSKSYPAQPTSATVTLITRQDFFKDIVGMDEDTFRRTMQWSALPGNPPWDRFNGQLRTWNSWSAKQKTDWVNAYPRRAAIFKGDFECWDLNRLYNELSRSPLPGQRQGKHRFILRIHDPKNPQFTDIRYLQSDPANEYASFQVASTFWGPLEGGMINFNSKLEGMLPHAVQGEEASIACAGATIGRKYIMPTENKGQSADQRYWYLLQEYVDKGIIKLYKGKSGLTKQIYYREFPKYDLMMQNGGLMRIGIHWNVIVTSGYGPMPESGGRLTGKDQQRQLPVGSDSQRVTQLFTSAYNLKPFFDANGVIKPSMANNYPFAMEFSQAILNVSYQTTLCAAGLNQNSNKLYLTLVGGGAFRNQLAWIQNALEFSVGTIGFRFQGQVDSPSHLGHRQVISLDLVRKLGLDVMVIYRPDDRHKFDQTEIFLSKMIELIDQINGTGLRYDNTLTMLMTDYKNALKNKGLNNKSALDNESALAQQINTYLENRIPKK